MEIAKHKKSATWKRCNTKRVQHYNMKKVHTKKVKHECNTKWVEKVKHKENIKI